MKSMTFLTAAWLCGSAAFATRYLVQTGAEGDAAWTRNLQDGEQLIDLSTQSQSLNDAYRNGENEWWLAAGTYELTGSINFVSGVQIYGGFAGTETSTAERAQAAGSEAWEFTNPTILSKEAASEFPIFTCTAVLNTEAVLDGVTVQNGYSTEHGAV